MAWKVDGDLGGEFHLAGGVTRLALHDDSLLGWMI
jgi:hypothetical protein